MPLRKTRYRRPTTRRGISRPQAGPARTGSASMKASIQSATPATAFISTMKSRSTAHWWARFVWRATSSPMPSGSPSWRMDGFAAVSAEAWQAPGHWREIDGQWHVMTLAGLKPVDPEDAVCHISYYEADAFARWRGKHLPTE